MATPPSHSQAVLPNPTLLVLDSVEREGNRFVLTVHIQQAARCPRCAKPSSAQHSHYIRSVHDLPWQGLSVCIRVNVRRFRCRNRDCRQKIFAERLPGIASVHARRTQRLDGVIRLVGYSTGGLPGSRLLDRLAVHVSDDTVLRAVKSGTSLYDEAQPIRHIGVDDWAWRKGQRYGTILVDLERHRVVDVLPDRSAEALAAWLRQHPTVETINRDRYGAYADGSARGAPDAVQIADRFHLVLNLSTAIERALEERRPELEFPASDDSGVEPKEMAQPVQTETAEQRRQQQRRQRRLERYQQVIELSRCGNTQRTISQAVGVSLKTIRRWLRAQHFPERKPVTGRRSHVREFDGYLRQRWEQGCRNSTQLYREIRGHGYRGSRQMVSHHVAQWRTKAKLGRKRGQRLAPKEAAIIICKRPEQRSTEQNELLKRLLGKHPTFHWMHILACDFRDTLRSQDGDRLQSWIYNAIQSGIGPLVRFAYGLRRDSAAVTAAIETHWSSGQVEGQINRLKSLKRQMYGRAGFTLLRARVLPYTAARPP